MPGRHRASLITVTLLAAVGLGGCGSSSPEGPGSRDDSLAQATNSLDGQLDDLRALSDGELEELAEDFIGTWTSYGESATSPDPQMARDARIELDALSLGGTMDVVYHPDLNTIMLLGGGGSIGKLVDASGYDVDGDPTEYFEVVGGEWVPIEGSQEMTEEEEVRVADGCRSGSLMRIGDGQWTSFTEVDLEGNQRVAARDIGSLSWDGRNGLCP